MKKQKNTNLAIKKRMEELDTGFCYSGNETKYPKYDNYDAINVDKVAEIPIYCEGVIGVPITFLGSHNPNQFEIVKFRKGNDNKDLRYGNKEPYFRLLIKRKTNK